MSNSDPAANTASSKIGWPVAAALVIGNMVGVGVFTSLGWQLVDMESGFSILLLWVIGGIYALCGALCYGELVAALPRCGGEYHLLSRVYHPAVGFLSGWISLTVGFAAPVAFSALLFGQYLAGSLGIAESAMVFSVLILLGVTACHLWKLPVGGGFQLLFTALKFILVLGLAIAGLLHAGGGTVSFTPTPGDWAVITGAPFAISLFYVNYSFAGWNAAAYVAGEIRDPGRNVPRALFLGTLAVLLLYLLVNAGFLASTPADKMAGKEDVGLVVARHIFGDRGGTLIGVLIAFGLVSAISAMTWAGPRVGQMLGQDYFPLRILAHTNRHRIPVVAITLQSLLALCLLPAEPKQIILYLEFVLNLSLAAAVLGVVVLRHRQPDLPRPFRCPLYPLPPFLFLAMACYLELRLLLKHPVESLCGLVTIGAGAVIYLWVRGKPVKSCMISDPVGRLRLLGMAEGVSFLVLLFVAMPFKYVFGLPQAVAVVGLVHGLLFILFCGALLNVTIVRRWTIGKALVPFVAALVPGGPFIIDRRLRAEVQSPPSVSNS
jgi:APA family basic amino acid/polyamine antiporter